MDKNGIVVLRLGGSADKVRHLHRDNHGELDKPAKHTLAEPRRLIDELLDARLFDGVCIGLVCPHHLFDLHVSHVWQESTKEIERVLQQQNKANQKGTNLGLCMGWVAVHEVLPNQAHFALLERLH